MNIVIVGDGKVGYALSKQLGDEGHSVTIIDNDSQALEESIGTLDVMAVLGNGACIDVQTEAGVPNSDLMIAATSRDELNMLCCLMAKHLGAKHTIARIRNPEYAKQLKILKEQFGLSMVINPELEAAREIAKVIKFPPALKVDSFSKGRVEIVGFKLKDNNPIVGKCLKDLAGKFGAKVLICAVERDGEIIIPNGGFMLETGDKIHITGESRNILSFLSSLGQDMFKIRNIMIVGGGKVCHYLTNMLDDRGQQVKIIEKSAARCSELCELLPRAVVICGDGTDLDLLESEGIDDMDAFIALTDIDEENMIVSMLANRKRIPKIISKVNRLHYLAIADEMGIDTTVNPKMAAVNQITQYVRSVNNTTGGSIKTLHKLFDGSVEALEFSAVEATRHRGIALEKLRLKKNLLVAAIVRDGKTIIPNGKDSIMLDDAVIIITNKYIISDLNDIFEDD